MKLKKRGGQLFAKKKLDIYKQSKKQKEEKQLFAKKKVDIYKAKQKAKRGEAVICKANQLDVVAISLLHQVAAITIIVQTPTQICNTVVTEIQKYRNTEV